MTTQFLVAILAVLTAHWVLDFLCQTEWMANNKSHNHEALAAHVTIYGLGISVVFLVIYKLGGFDIKLFLFGGGLVSIMHWVTDWLTSKATAGLWMQKKMHDFFAVIGLDQLLHQVQLLCVLWLFAI